MSLPRNRFSTPALVQSLRGALCGLVAVMGMLVCDADACPLQLPTLTVNVNGIQLSLEIAATPKARKCGLSGRNGLPPNNGMLFVLPESMPFAVWMKDTRLPLSVAFLDSSGRILSIGQMPPLRTDVIYESPQPIRYAIEVNQGWFNEQDIRIGDVIELSLPVGVEVR